MDIVNFKRYVNSLYLDRGQFYIIGTGVLLMYGMIKEVDDVDILVSHDVFEKLKSVFTFKNSPDFPYVYKVNDILDICEGIVRREDYRLIEGIPVKKIEYQKEWYENSNRQADVQKVLTINKYYKRSDIHES